MMHKVSLQLLILLLIFSFVLSSAFVPTRRSLLQKKNKSSIQTTLVQDASDFRNGEEKFDMAEEFMVEGRMDFERNDYPGTGANNRHDPKTPGRA
ncbi:hypothetical protein TanjilG_20566 [Lupinus angustifolius]|uniref:Uncharacterized protein n=1 Tax=Lupinus angustifolius TaxID=3871 RepID=A0A1J7GS40_LUPAN|nr:PREDICTED: uncharacterized protein LOC109358952 [Lupinus angustifolius]OIW03262.1 hypothetical protein TanjilG_20566 [Lupinus angustifolius]